MTRAARLHAASLVASVWIATACGGGTEPPPPVQELSQEARSHLEQVLGLMQANSIKRLEIDWNDFRARVFAAAAGAQTIAGTYEAIRTAIGLLGDGHSSYRTSTGATIFVPTRTCNAVPIVTAPTLPATIGYVRVRSFSGTAQQAVTFATSIQEAIKAADLRPIHGERRLSVEQRCASDPDCVDDGRPDPAIVRAIGRAG